MARIVYGLSGQGRGHSSRVLAISEALRLRGHEVLFCCGGTAKEVLESAGEDVLTVPALRQIIRSNKIRLLQTVACNWGHVTQLSGIVDELANRLSELRPDLVITDFEAFSPRAAQKAGIPVLSFNHQQIVTEMVYDLPAKYRFTSLLASLVIGLIAPRSPAHILLSSFFFGELKHPSHTTLVPPIIRSEVQAVEPSDEDHILVYFNQTEGSEHVIEALSVIDAEFHLYNFNPPLHASRYANLTFKRPSLHGFLEDLASSRAVICTAGFTLISECLYLGKPLLVVPNRGIFEQTINALFLQVNGLGAAVIDRPLSPEDVRQFLENNSGMGARLRTQAISGNGQAIQCIESILAHPGPMSNVNKRVPWETPLASEAVTHVAKSP